MEGVAHAAIQCQCPTSAGAEMEALLMQVGALRWK